MWSWKVIFVREICVPVSWDESGRSDLRPSHQRCSGEAGAFGVSAAGGQGAGVISFKREGTGCEGESENRQAVRESASKEPMVERPRASSLQQTRRQHFARSAWPRRTSSVAPSPTVTPSSTTR
eukprot:2824412-Pleurochrysis_carterae.AAC.1